MTPFERYENAARTECIDLMGCAEFDESLDRLRDSVFHCLVSNHYGKRPSTPYRQVAEEWVAIVQKTPEHLKLPQEKHPPANRVKAFYRP